MKKLVIMASMMFGLTACDDNAALDVSEVFAFSGSIHEIEVTSSGLIVLSDEGLLHFEGNELSQTTPSSWRSDALVQVGPERYLANLPYHSSFAEENYGHLRVIESLDAGLSWQLVTHNYTVSDVSVGFAESPHFFAYDVSSNQLFAGISGSVFGTTDYGRHWELLRGHGQDMVSGGGWGGEYDIQINSPKQVLWLFGGDSSDGKMMISRWSLASDSFESWKPIDDRGWFYTGWSNPQDSNHLLAVSQSQVIATYDNGSNWELVLDAGAKVGDGAFTSLQELPNRSESLLVSAESRGDEGYPSVLYCSNDSGVNWQRVSFSQGAPKGGISAMTADSDYLYLAVSRRGVFKVALTDLTAQGC